MTRRFGAVLLLALAPGAATAHPVEVVAPPPGVLQTIGVYVASGIHHIAIGPDHILFIFGLILMGGKLRRLLQIVTAFTLAHSITLAVAALGWVHPRGALVEPLIALSIVWVGIDNLLWKRTAGGRDLRPLTAFAFGLIHGFGFAGVLADFGLPHGRLGVALASFNLGIEIVQAALVAATAPVLAALARHSPAMSRRLQGFGSLAIAAAGFFWLFQRLLPG